LSPNGQDQLPGRLQRLRFALSRDAGPVKCIRSFCDAIQPDSTPDPFVFLGQTLRLSHAMASPATR
jgi:hypothetical protein